MKQPTLAEISKFLTQEMIEKAFRSRTKSEDSIQFLDVSRAAPVGEGLLSVVFRIRVTGFQHCTSFIAKALMNDPLLVRTLNCSKFFKKEADFFSTILPMLKEIQISLGAEERIQNHIPICYDWHQDGINDYILLEDLNETGCVSLPVTPSDEQRNNVLKVLAQIHAVSLASKIRRPEEFSKIITLLPETYLYEENREWYSKFLSRAIDINRELIVELEDPNSLYYKKFKMLLESDLYGQLIATVSNQGEYSVLCHGDAWSPNFLTSPQRTVTIDFQAVRYASPATDLSYWIMLCSSSQTTKQDYLNAVDIYYNSMEYHLRDMGLSAAKVFPRTALDKELKHYGKYGYLACLTSFPLLAADKGNILEFTEDNFPGVEKIPLESLWPLTPMDKMEDKLRLVNAVHIAVDMGFI